MSALAGVAATLLLVSACRPAERARVRVPVLRTQQAGTFTLEAKKYQAWEDLDVAQGPSPPGSPSIREVKRIDQCFAWSLEVEQLGKLQKARCPVAAPGERDCSSSVESGGEVRWRRCRVPNCAFELAASGPTTVRATLERSDDVQCQHLALTEAALILTE